MRIVALITPALLLIPLFFWPQLTEASVSISGDLITISPAAPGPYAPATISITDATQRPVGSSVRWYVNGIEMTQDKDASSLTITTGGVGEEVRVEARLTAPNQGEESASASIKPVRLDLIVGANTSVPHFYRGRALPSKASEISVQAFLFGDVAGPFRYRWTINAREEIAQVGSGTNQITFKPNLDHEMNVYVEVRDGSNRLVAQGGVVIPLSNPEVHFYESNPLHGLIPNVLTYPYYFLNDEITLRAEPFYFTGALSGFDIAWEVDGRTIASDENPLELSLVKTQEEGRALIGLSIINTSNYLETAGKELLFTY